jgi:hypothetical protein
MCVSDCGEGKRLLEAAAQPNPGSAAREALLEHIKHCPVCNPGGTQDCTDPRKL